MLFVMVVVVSHDFSMPYDEANHLAPITSPKEVPDELPDRQPTIHNLDET